MNNGIPLHNMTAHERSLELLPPAEGPALLAAGRRPATHRDLAQQIERAGMWFQAHGIAPGERVALRLPPGPEMAVALICAVVHGAALPTNPAAPSGEIEELLERTATRALMLPAGVDPGLRAALHGRGVTVLDIHVDTGLPAGLFDTPWSGGATPRARPRVETSDAVVLILQTSGTTARPKLVPLTRGSLLHGARAVADSLALQPRDRSLLVMPLFHVHGIVAGLLAPLTAGGSVACPGVYRPGQFFEWLRAYEPTYYTAVPAIHHSVAAEWRERGRPRARSSLRLVRASSASLPPGLAAELTTALGVPVIEAYGMTEASHQMASGGLLPGQRRPGTVGRAAGAELCILRDDAAVVAAGRGEIVARGPGVIREYLDDPAATASAFTRGWFRTGDEGTIDQEGFVAIVGRLKEMINRGGEKIAPAEIEAVALAFPGVAQAAAYAVAHPTLGEDCALAIVPEPGSEFQAEGLRRFMIDRLPLFKVPSSIRSLPALPRSAAGKVQRIGLAQRLAAAPDAGPMPGAIPGRADAAFVEAVTWLCAQCAELLQRPRVQPDDDFFELGGDSLRGMQLLSRVEQAHGVHLDLVDLFRNPQPQALAALVLTEREAAWGGLVDALDEIEGLTETQAQHRAASGMGDEG